MSTRIQQLVAVFGARFDGFLAGLRRAGTQTQTFRTQSTSAFQSVQQTVTRVSASTVVALDKTAKAAKRTARTHVELEQTVTTAYQQMDESQEEMSASADDGAQQTTKLSEAIQELDAALTQVAQNVYNVLAPIVTESAKAGFALIKLKDNALVSFGGLLNSELRARVLLTELGDLAAKTPFDMPGLVDLSQRLLAVGVTADQIVPTLTNVGNAVARVGGSKESVEKVTAALIQMMGDAQITNETMRVLTEAGLDPWQALARTIGTDVPTAMDLVAQGAIRTDQVFGTLVANLGANAAGAMAAQNQTLTGLLETLYEKFSEASAKIFEPLYRGLTEFLAWAMGPQGLSLGPMIDNLRDSVEQISDNVFGFFRDNGQRLVEDFGTALTVAADCVVSLTGVLRDWGPVVLDAAEAIGSVVKWIVEFVMQCPEVVAAVVAIKALFLTGIPQAVMATIHVLQALGLSFGGLPALAVAAGVAIGAWLYQSNQDIQEFNKQLERSAELQKQLAEKREKRFQETLTQADQIADPAERKKFLQAELERAKKEQSGKVNQLTMAKDEVKTASKNSWVWGDKTVELAREGVKEAEQDVDFANSVVDRLEKALTKVTPPPVIPPVVGPLLPPPEAKRDKDREDADRNKEIANAQIKAAERSDKMLEGLGDLLDFMQSGASPQQVEAMAKTFAGATPELAAALAQALAQGGDPRAASEAFVRGANENVAREDRSKTADQSIDKVQGEFGGKLPAFALAEFNKGLQILQNQFVSGAITEEQFRAGLQSIENASRNTIAVQNELKSSMEQYGESLTGPFKAKFEELRAQLTSGAIGIDQFRKEVKGLTEQSEKAAEAEKRRKLLAGDFAGAGLDLKAAVEERLASKKMQEFNTMADNIANRLTGASEKVQDFSQDVKKAGDAAQSFSEKVPSADEVSNFWQRLSQFMQTIDGQRALILNQLALLRQSMQITKDALSQRELQAKIDDLIRALQVLDQQEAALPTFIGDRGELEFKDPGLSKDGGGGGRRGVFGPDGNGGGGGISLSFPNLTRITQTEASLLADAVVRETSRRGRALSR